MNSLLPFTTTATELQRNYKRVVARAKKLGRPVTVLSNNKPELIVMDYSSFKKDSLKKAGKKSGLEAVFGSWTKEEADKFDKIIEEAFEQIDPEDWK